jgi:hypothetical protein
MAATLQRSRQIGLLSETSKYSKSNSYLLQTHFVRRMVSHRVTFKIPSVFAENLFRCTQPIVVFATTKVYLLGWMKSGESFQVELPALTKRHSWKLWYLNSNEFTGSLRQLLSSASEHVLLI